MNIQKESLIEYAENIYALGVTHLKNDDSFELQNLLKQLELVEDEIRLCDNTTILNGYELVLKNLLDKIEGIVNE